MQAINKQRQNYFICDRDLLFVEEFVTEYYVNWSF